MAAWSRIVIHADMDAFYAAVEQLDDPSLRGKPILVGPKSHRGVVLTASYEARPYGVGSAMPVAEARRRCPNAIMVEPRFERYQEISEQVMDIFADFSPRVEALSLDEAFLDMTGAEHIFGPPLAMATKLKAAVKEATELDISVGVSSTKYVAKVASAHEKPNGLTVVPEEHAVAWLAPLSISRLWGVGKKTAPKLLDLGLRTIGDVAAKGEPYLKARLGSLGTHIHQLSNAMDPRVVSRGRRAQSIGSDRTLSRDVVTSADIETHLRRSADRIARRVRAKDLVAGGIRIRLKTTDFALLTRQRHLATPTDTAADYLTLAMDLLEEFPHPGPFRMVGMTAFDLQQRADPVQRDLFEATARRNLEAAIDDLIQRFGKDVVVRAKDLGHPGTISSNGVNLDFLDGKDDG